MYYPILRGKQFELIALRELAGYIQPDIIRPVIEPVRGNLAPLIKTIEVLSDSGIVPLVIINPTIGDFANGSVGLLELIKSTAKFTPCIKAKSVEDLSLLKKLGLSLPDSAVFIESGIDKALLDQLQEASCVLVNKDRAHSGAISRLRNVVLFGDFFEKKVRNADYKEKSFYSSLHTEWRTYKNAIGFGDYTILSEEYSEAGGPAYVVTIHLSYIDNDEFDAMYVRHFSSFNDDSPANPGGKFKSALEKVSDFIVDNSGVFIETRGLQELLSLRGNPFPGLGQVKKYSMKHHIETTCEFVRGD
ncbi:MULTISPECIES: sce7725 family protein [unclassified Pseudomonas]|uniref:sce7725 family protein n=1 Tax=unclassified Pseudomonas TaxID=196821 RepID=UPI000A1D595A|nr:MULTISPECIES: sce7725 family protein [unclassified Pseudomonas]MDI2142779.1 sce7725 family protein [Pseudomonas sp. ITA]